MLEPGDERPWKIEPGGEHDSEMEEKRHVGCLRWRRAPARFTESDAVETQQQAAERDQDRERQRDCQEWRTRECRGEDEKLARENAEWRQSGDRNNTQHKSPAKPGVGFGKPTDVADTLRPFHLGDMSHGKEDSRFGEAVHWHVQKPGEIRERA